MRLDFDIRDVSGGSQFDGGSGAEFIDEISATTYHSDANAQCRPEPPFFIERFGSDTASSLTFFVCWAV